MFVLIYTKICTNLISAMYKAKDKLKNIGETIIIKGNRTNGVNRLNSEQKATNLKKKVGINEMYSNC